MSSSRILLLLALVGCSQADPARPPELGALPAAVLAGAELHLSVDPLPAEGDSLVLVLAGVPVPSVKDDSGLTFIVPDTLNGAMEVHLAFNGDLIEAGSIDILGFVGSKEASTWIGAGWWNIVTIELAGVTYLWGSVASDGLGRLTPSSGLVTTYPDLLSTGTLRVPGPTSVPGRWVLAPPAAVAVDSLELWQLAPFVTKVGRIPRMGIQRQAGEVAEGVWLVTYHHGVQTIDLNHGTVPYSQNSYEESQVVFRSLGGDRTTITFHGSSLGTPVFGPDGHPVFHVLGMRGPAGVAFSRDSARMILVGYSQDYSNLLMEVELDDGERVDSIPLSYAPRAVAIDELGRAYVLGEGAGGRPFVDIFARPGYRRLGRMQASASVRACASGCIDGVLAFDLLSRRIYAVDAADPSFAGGTGNGIWAFHLPPLLLEAARR